VRGRRCHLHIEIDVCLEEAEGDLLRTIGIRVVIERILVEHHNEKIWDGKGYY